MSLILRKRIVMLSPSGIPITYNLTNVASSNTDNTVAIGGAYSTTLSADQDYVLGSVTVTMGGTDITSAVYSNGVVSIANVTDAVVIIAVGVPIRIEIDYLQSDGNQIIDTGLGGDLNTEIEVGFKTVNTSSQPLLGSRGDNTNSIQIYISSSGTQRFGNKATSIRFSNNTDYTIILNKTSLIYNGTTADIKATTAFTTPTNIFFFGNNTTKSTVRIYYLKIRQGGILVRDFIPVRLGDTGYMYDKISDSLFSNTGTGSFILGNDKE